MPPLVVICHIFPCFRPPNVPSSRTVQFLAPFINPARIPPFFPLLPDVGHRWGVFGGYEGWVCDGDGRTVRWGDEHQDLSFI